MKISKSKELKCYIPTASMADIAFLLIIFFMITAQFDVDKTILTLPKSTVRQDIEKESAVVIAAFSPDLVIKFTSGREQSQPLSSVDDVLSVAAQEMQLNPTKSFVIKADGKVRYGVIDQIIDRLRQAHVQNIYFLTMQETK
jgi:biopolymer transport protein ExbD